MVKGIPFTGDLFDLNFDEYKEVLNGKKTYKGIANLVYLGGAALIGWTDGLGSHFDILFVSGVLPSANTIQGGVRGLTDLLVSIMRKGAFGFEVTNEDTHYGYYAEKLGMSSASPTAERLGDLINGVKKQLYKNRNEKNRNSKTQG